MKLDYMDPASHREALKTIRQQMSTDPQELVNEVCVLEASFDIFFSTILTLFYHYRSGLG